MHHRSDSIVIRQVLSDLAAIDRAGRMDELGQRLTEARRVWQEQHLTRTLGETLRANELADIAAGLLGEDCRVCQDELAYVLGWPEAARAAVRQLAHECGMIRLPRLARSVEAN